MPARTLPTKARGPDWPTQLASAAGAARPDELACTLSLLLAFGLLAGAGFHAEAITERTSGDRTPRVLFTGHRLAGPG